MKFTLALLLVLIMGCAIGPQTEVPPEQLELVSMVPLPPLTSILSAGGLKLNVIMHVMADGSVQSPRFAGSSGDPAWDTVALQSIKQWRYVPSRQDRWVRQLVIVQIQEPVFMDLGELVCPSLQVADSLSGLMEKGMDFATIMKQLTGSSSQVKAGVRKAVNIAVFPQRVREELSSLGIGERTAPLKVGDKFFIYERLTKEVAKSLPD